MIRIKCPKCANPLGIPDKQAGSVGSCPKCGQKFRVPAGSAKASDPSRPEADPKATAGSQQSSPPKGDRKQAAMDAPASRPGGKAVPAARQRPAAEHADQGYGVAPTPGGPTILQPSEKRPAEEDDEEPDEQEQDEQKERIKGKAPGRKKRKKKKKKPETSGFKSAHIALVVVGVFVVAAATGILFLILHGRSKAPADPGPVLAELKEARASIERDEKSPDKPVIGITLSGCTFKPSLLGRLVVFPQLHKLHLGNTLTSDINLEWLEDVTTLRVLDLGHTKVTGGGMQFLKKLVNLEELNLTQTLVTDIGLRELKGLTKLKKIYLDGTLASGLELKDSNPGLEIVR